MTVTAVGNSDGESFKADWPRGNYSWIPNLTLATIAFIAFSYLMFRHGSGSPWDLLFKLIVLAIPLAIAVRAIWRVLDPSPYIQISMGQLRFHPSLLRRAVLRGQLDNIEVQAYERYGDNPHSLRREGLTERSGEPIPHIVIHYFAVGEPASRKSFLWVSRAQTAAYARKLQEFGWL